MKHAVELPQYSDTKEFVPPDGLVQVKLDKATNLIADAACPDDYTATFLEGTQPTDTCDHSNGDQRNLFQRLFGLGEKPPNAGPVPNPSVVTPQQQPVPAQTPASAALQNQPPAAVPGQQKKPGFFKRLFGGGKKDQQDSSQKPAPQQPQ